MKQQLTFNRLGLSKLIPHAFGKNAYYLRLKTVLYLLLCTGIFQVLQAQVYSVTLSGTNESPPNTSTASGTATVTINSTLNTMRVQANFTGLTGTTTAAHIHAATAVAGTGTAGVATTTPNFTGFPLGVTSGSYDMTYDMTTASSYNAAYITANGGSTAAAFTALKAAIVAGKSYFNIHTSSFPGGEIRGFLRASCSSVFYAYNATNNHLVSFSADQPGTLLSDVALTGLGSGERLLGIDYRPADGKLYGVTSNTSNVGRVVSINRITGVISAVGVATQMLDNTASYGVDFNPVPDRIRLLSSNVRSLRLNPNDGTLSGTDTPPFFTASDANFGATPSITQCAYTKSVPSTPNTTLFAIDNNLDILVKIGGTNGVPSPNLGATTTVGSLGVNVSGVGGFDIEPTNNLAYASLSVGGVSSLYMLDTTSGAATLIGAIGAGGLYEGLTIVPCSAPALCAPVVYAYNSTNQHLISFNAATPGTLLSDVALSGLNAGERILGIDYRPADGLFYSVTTNASSVGRVVSINKTTGSVAAVGSATHTIDNTVAYGIDFNPVPDRIRLLADNGSNRRFNPNDGTLSGTDTPPTYAAGDPNFNTAISLTQIAYTKSIAGTPNTTLFAIDNTKNLLVRVGGVNGTPSPNLGVATSIGALGVTADKFGGFDIEPTYNTAYAALTVAGVSQFYIIDTLTGAATLVGAIGGGGSIDGLSVMPCIAPACATPVNRLYVDASVAVSGTGSSWTCAIKELSTAIAMANATPAINTIFVADGTYKPAAAGRYSRFDITRANLRIVGGFAGGEANSVDANPTLNPTIISGDVGVINDNSDNAYQILRLPSLPANQGALVIDGFIVENGNANGSGDANGGAALYAYSVPTTTPVMIRRTIFRNNMATGNGGAVNLNGASITFDGCRFMNNSATGGGAAVYSFSSSSTFNNTVFTQNTTANGGGAYYGNIGMATFNKVAFSGNMAAYGAAVYQNRLDASYTNTVFNANNATQQGGALFVHNYCVANITNSTFFKNNATNNGGSVLLNYGGTTNVANSIFWWNTINGAASKYADVGDFGGGANTYANNILQAGSAIPMDNGGTIRNNLRGANPLFVNEMNVLGADMMWGTADDGLALTMGSPARNTGDNALNTQAMDITNSPRVVCTTVDRGAYERQGDCGPVAEIDDTNVFVAAKATASNGNGAVTNPFNNDLQIRYMGTEKAGITVISASGKTMSMLGNVKEGITHIDASSWSAGMYQAVITTASGKKINFKVVKL